MALKAVRAVKAVKAVKASSKAKPTPRVSKVARGRYAKVLVLRGRKERTAGGLKADNLFKNKRGKVVSKKASAAGQRQYRNIEAWVEAHMSARAALRVTGFAPLNGRTLTGKALYVKTRALYAASRQGR
uniref:Uncharacterized protein n=1 Tax=Noctiluca scintillans TaxID=2966 RepID=A0A7S1A9E6_NOCSC